jgi:hypothetical protein
MGERRDPGLELSGLHFAKGQWFVAVNLKSN